ncbi:MAG: threonine synthase [Candidatus Cloacimonetes bacterium]|nr:threonine synthase [Candidatus Cloacimonadota bacterium]
MYFLSYRCTLCQAEYQRSEVQYLCPDCSKDNKKGTPLKGVLEVLFDYQKIAEQWRIKPNIELFSPIEKRYYPEIPVGNTPFYRTIRLEKYLQRSNIWIKNDALNPSGSLKDRASYLMVAEAKRLGYDTIVTASTGNAASALAAMAAAQGIKAVIFVPANAPQAKIAQIKIHNAQLIEVNGDYDEAFFQSLEYTAQQDGLNRNTAYHPFTVEGKKSAGLEIFVQNGCKVPDWIIIPVGDGVILAGIYKAFIDLQRAKIIDRIPKLLAVQSNSSAAIVNYWQTGEYENAVSPETIADSISVKAPSNAYWARQCLIDSNGYGTTVTDEEILNSQKKLAETTGVYAEPAASATMAGLIKGLEINLFTPDDQIVLLITGHGLKSRFFERIEKQ